MHMKGFKYTKTLGAMNLSLLSVILFGFIMFIVFYLDNIELRYREYALHCSFTVLCLNVFSCMYCALYAFFKKPRLELCLNVYAFQIKELVLHFNRRTPNLKITFQMYKFYYFHKMNI